MLGNQRPLAQQASARQFAIGAFFGLAIGLPGLFATPACAQSATDGANSAGLPTWAARRASPLRRALVIGIDGYTFPPVLVTPKIDTRLLGAALEGYDFNIETIHDPDYTQLLRAIDDFRDTISPGDFVVVHFSGHGVEVAGQHYLVPLNAKPAGPEQIGRTYVGVQHLMRTLLEREPGLVLILFDACRTDPFVGAPPPEEEVLDIAQPLATESSNPQPAAAPRVRSELRNRPHAQPKGVVLAFASGPGERSWSLRTTDRPSDGSLFTRAIVKWIQPERSLGWILQDVATEVEELSGARQMPWITEPGGHSEVMFRPSSEFIAQEEETWRRAVHLYQDTGSVSSLRRFVGHYPLSVYSAAARAEIAANDAREGRRFASQGSMDEWLGGALATRSDGEGGRSYIAARDLSIMALTGARRVEAVTSGQELEVLGLEANGWARVLTESGRLGRVRGVLPTAVDETFELDVGTGGTVLTESPVLDAAAASLRSLDGTLVVAVGGGDPADPASAEASRLAFLTSLRLHDALLARGVRSSQIDLLDAPGPARAGEARIQILRTSEVP